MTQTRKNRNSQNKTKKGLFIKKATIILEMECLQPFGDPQCGIIFIQ
jgi:hypothetical protein